MPDSLHNAALAYLQHLRISGKKERTLYTYSKDLEQVETYFGRDRDLHTILPAEVGKFYTSDALLKSSNGKIRADETVKKTKRVLRMFLVWAKEKGLIDELPLPKGTPMGRSLIRSIENEVERDSQNASTTA